MSAKFKYFLIVLLLSSVTTWAQTHKATKASASVDWKDVDSAMGRAGQDQPDGTHKYSLPRKDLNVTLNGVQIKAGLALGSWVAFKSVANGNSMVMGDIVLTENDLGPVQQEIIKQGLTSTAIHNHFVRNSPNIMYMHIGGSGNTELMAQKAKAILDKVNETRNGDPSKGTASNEAVENTLDTKKLDEILGYKAEMSKGVYKYTIGRPDVKLSEHGVPISTFLGFNTWAAWQGTPEKAAVAGDFTMLENEVEPVLKALISGGIEVVALHNHMVHEQPRIFFLHYWGVGNAEKLAKTLRSALDQTGKQQSKHEMKM